MDGRIVGNKNTLNFRRKLRKEPTTAEKILWIHLRNRKLGGLKFRRQHGIGKFIVDFYQPDSKTIIELDGDVHFNQQKQVNKDKEREMWLKSNGYKIIRINNVEVFNNLGGVLDHIYYNLMRDLTLPSP